MTLDRRFLIWGLCYAVLGMALGIYMAATQNHAELVTHAHILLLGFVVSFIYGLIHKLWLRNPGRGIAQLQFVLHQAATLTVSAGLFLLYGGFVAQSRLEAVLALGSLGVLLALLLMLYMVVRFSAAPAGTLEQAVR